MISILAQERLLGAALGSAFVGGIVIEQRRGIYKSIQPTETTSYKATEAIPRNKYTMEFAHMWNKAVDQTLGSLVAYLSSRGW